MSLKLRVSQPRYCYAQRMGSELSWLSFPVEEIHASFSMVRTLLDGNSSHKARRRLAALSRKPVRPMLESLEERLTPSAPTQTAASYSDLVNAVAADTASNTNYVIEVTNNFTFNSGWQVSISKLGAGSMLTIEGQNGANSTLTGNGSRLFTIGSGQNVTFENLTLTGGAVTNIKGSAQGGAIEDLGGNVTLSAATLQNDTVAGSFAEGGGIYVSGGGNLTIKSGSVIQSNQANGSNFASGGGVYVNGTSGGSTTIALRDSILSNNSARANTAPTARLPATMAQMAAMLPAADCSSPAAVGR